MQNVFELVKSISIEKIIERYCDICLRKTGSRWTGSCPFHDDTNPSFTVYVETNSWYCFGCGVGGDGIDFLKLLTGQTALEAAKSIITDFGQELQQDKPSRNPGKRLKAVACERKLRAVFDERVDHVYSIVCSWIRTAERALILDQSIYFEVPEIVHQLAAWHYMADCLQNGDLAMKISILKEMEPWLDLE